MSEFATPFIYGFGLQAALIAAMGAQNLYVLESGLKRRKHWQVAALCAACDAGLIAFGVLGVGQIFLAVPILKVAMGAAGVAFLIWYAVQKLRDGLTAMGQANSTASGDFSRPLLTALAFSLLNPHVYLDTVVLIGGFSLQYLYLNDRLAFGAGAAAFSTVWFFGLAGFASLMSHTLTSPQAARALALGSAIVLFVLAGVLGWEVFSWTLSWLK